MTMFSYYGAKSRIAKYYPKPLYDTIIEPFAGAANYSLLYANKNCILYDKYEVVIRIWKWLQTQTAESINELPRLRSQPITHIQPIEAQWWLSFQSNQGTAKPRNWAGSIGSRTYSAVMRDIEKINHWQCIVGDYTECPDIQATWFIDPPYSNTKHDYVHANIDYTRLAEWVLTRKGQVIVCERGKATWLPFSTFREYSRGQHEGYDKELIYYRVNQRGS